MPNNGRRTYQPRPLAARRDLAPAPPLLRADCCRHLTAASVVVEMVLEVLVVVDAADRRLGPAGCHGHPHCRPAVLEVLLSMMETIRRRGRGRDRRVGRGCARGRMLRVLLLCVRSLRDAESLTCSASRQQTAYIPAALSVFPAATAIRPSLARCGEGRHS